MKPAPTQCEIDARCALYIRRVSLLVNALRGKWTLQILCAMRAGPVRLGQLVRLLPKASKKGLRACLRDLEAVRIIVRHDLTDTVLHVEYDFAENMRKGICDLLDQLADWGAFFERQTSASAVLASPMKAEPQQHRDLLPHRVTPIVSAKTASPHVTDVETER